MFTTAEMRTGASITVGLRYDDYSASSPSDLEARILEICARYRVPCTFGVIPEVSQGPGPASTLSLPETKREMLRRAQSQGILEVALHGYTHRIARAGTRTEFAGVPESTQVALISKGKADLESFAGPIHTFIPPWNSYDNHTLTALAFARFTILSAEGMGDAGVRCGLRLMPATCLIWNLRKAVEAGRRLVRERPGSKIIIIPCFHPYEFKESGSSRANFSIRGFEETLAWLASQTDVETRTLGDIGGLPELDLATFAGYTRRRRLAPHLLRRAATWFARETDSTVGRTESQARKYQAEVR